MSTTIYSRIYLLGWTLPLAMFALPIATYSDVGASSVMRILAVVVTGYLVSRLAERGSSPRADEPAEFQVSSRALFRVAVIFTILSIVGGQLVLMEQSSFLAGWTFDNLEERYTALIQSAADASATNSVWSALGNLLRSLFFVGVASLVLYTKNERSWLRRIVLCLFVAAALLQSFFVNVSRLQFIFYLIYAVVTSKMVSHPILKQKRWLLAAFTICVIFVLRTTDQRIANTFDDSAAAASFISDFFGADLQPFGQFILDRLGLSMLVLVVYISQTIPEFVRLVLYNNSPYSLGAHSFFLVLSPIARALGSPLTTDTPAISNQGLWWGFLGDLYLDFGAFYIVAYLCALLVMIRLARCFENSGICGLAFRALTVSMILIIPFTGIFNTYAVSYFALLAFALLEKRAGLLKSRASAELERG